MAFDGTIGVQESGVSQAISDLEHAKSALTTWRNDMFTLKGQVAAEWLGDAKDEFEANYTRLDSDMQTMEDAVHAFEQWAQETMDSYRELDQAQVNSMSQI